MSIMDGERQTQNFAILNSPFCNRHSNGPGKIELAAHRNKQPDTASQLIRDVWTEPCRTFTTLSDMDIRHYSEDDGVEPVQRFHHSSIAGS